MTTAADALKMVIEAKAGAEAVPVPAPGGRASHAVMYKVMGKIFAILSVRGDGFVILKCDPHLAEVLREQYAGVGRRSHLDRRRWISVELDSDVPPEEVEGLVGGSYALICSELTRKQKAALAALGG